MKRIIAILIFTAAAVTAHAQSVSPLVVECGRKCNGSFTVTNDQNDVLNVTVEPFSFNLSPQGKTLFEPLSKDADVTMKEMAARVPPHGEWQFDYNIRCGQPPCRVALVTAMTVGKPNPDGLTIRMIIPEIIYSCEKQRGCRAVQRASFGLGEFK
jgi:hypothetical protein